MEAVQAIFITVLHNIQRCQRIFDVIQTRCLRFGSIMTFVPLHSFSRSATNLFPYCNFSFGKLYFCAGPMGNLECFSNLYFYLFRNLRFQKRLYIDSTRYPISSKVRSLYCLKIAQYLVGEAIQTSQHLSFWNIFRVTVKRTRNTDG